jgi:hypothetical protein
MEIQYLVTPPEDPAHRSVLVQGILTKDNVTTLQYLPYSPNLAATDFYVFPGWNQHWRDDAFVMILTFSGKRLKSWSYFHKIASRNVFGTFRVLAEIYSFTWELLRIKPSLIICNIVYFSAINLSLKHFESTTYYPSTSYKFIHLKTYCISS